jgi:hypothetical protein
MIHSRTCDLTGVSELWLAHGCFIESRPVLWFVKTQRDSFYLFNDLVRLRSCMPCEAFWRVAQLGFHCQVLLRGPCLVCARPHGPRSGRHRPAPAHLRNIVWAATADSCVALTTTITGQCSVLADTHPHFGQPP